MNNAHIMSAISVVVGISMLVAPLVGEAKVEDQVIPVDLQRWTAEHYLPVPGFDPAVWTVAGDGLSVFQSENGQPTFFYSDFPAFNIDLQGSVIVTPSWDNDYIGFALGFQPGDSSNPDAEYLLVDWKQHTQDFDFGPPSDTPGSTAHRGLSVSRVFGIPTAGEFWGHENLDPFSDPNNGLEELARGFNLGDTGWESGREYTFRFEFSTDSVRVYVDDVLELEEDLTASLNDGRFAFYNFSQEEVRYSCFLVVATRLYLPLIQKQWEGPLAVDKRVMGLDRDSTAPNYVTFTIAITNVGPVTIDVSPLLDEYDPDYLSFEAAIPAAEEDADDGLITWLDLTTSAPYGFDSDLPPKESFVVTTVFRIARDITETVNTAIVKGAVDIFGNLAREVRDDATIMDATTLVELLYFQAVGEESAVRLEWATAAEVGTVGFYVYRAPDDHFKHAQAIAYTPATGSGSTYSHVDRDVTPGQVYWYWLVEVSSSGLEPPYGPVWGGIGLHTFRRPPYLPLIQSGWEGQVVGGPSRATSLVPHALSRSALEREEIGQRRENAVPSHNSRQAIGQCRDNLLAQPG